MSRTARRGRPLANGIAPRLFAQRFGIRALWPIAAAGLAAFVTPVTAAPDSPTLIVAQTDSSKPGAKTEKKPKTEVKSQAEAKSKPEAKKSEAKTKAEAKPKV